MPRSWDSCCGRTCCQKPGSPRRQCGSCGRCCATGVSLVRLRTRLRNRIHAIVAGYGHDRPAGGYRAGPGRAWLASLELPAVFRELAGDYLGLIDAAQARIDRLDWEIRQRARPWPAGHGAHPAARSGPVHRAGHPRRGRRHQPVRLGAPAGVVGRAHPDRPRQRPGPPATGTSPNRARHGCAGCCARRRKPPSAPQSSRPPSSAWRNGGGRRSPPPPSPASWLPAPGACSPTPSTPQPRNLPRPRRRRGDSPRRGRMAPGELEEQPEPGPGPRSKI
jgi:hypothetical protein